MFNFLLDRAGEFMARIVSAILSAVISVLRSIAVKLMIWISTCSMSAAVPGLDSVMMLFS